VLYEEFDIDSGGEGPAL